MLLTRWKKVSWLEKLEIIKDFYIQKGRTAHTYSPILSFSISAKRIIYHEVFLSWRSHLFRLKFHTIYQKLK